MRDLFGSVEPGSSAPIVDRRPRSVRRRDEALQYDWGWGQQTDMFGSEHKQCALNIDAEATTERERKRASQR